MTGDELRRLMRAHRLTQQAMADCLGMSQAAVGRMCQREHIGRVNARAVRYVLEHGPEDRPLEPGEILREWRSRKQLAWYSGISLSTLGRLLSGEYPITPRMSMAIRQAQIDRASRVIPA